ncbi:MAG: glutaminyl-peptide cyclotransferase [Theionarchaea archaeon]|nr:glutaminyl-peptide cyclotransferase [Theionarchaea archaeon]
MKIRKSIGVRFHITRTVLSQFLPVLVLLAVLTVVGCTYQDSDIQFYTYKIINTYPHDPTAFTQGLVFDNSFIYEGTGLRGQSSLRKVDLETGTIIQAYELPPQFFGEGITIYENTIIQLTWQSHTGFVYDKETFELLKEFTYPTEGWGITHDGTKLIMSDGTSILHFLDPETFEKIGSINVYDTNGPVTRLNELEYINREIYANVWQTDYIVRIHSQTGQVTGRIDLEGLLTPEECNQRVDVLNGIAYDAENGRLFVTGKWWPYLFEIELIPENSAISLPEITILTLSAII